MLDDIEFQGVLGMVRDGEFSTAQLRTLYDTSLAAIKASRSVASSIAIHSLKIGSEVVLTNMREQFNGRKGTITKKRRTKIVIQMHDDGRAYSVPASCVAPA